MNSTTERAYLAVLRDLATFYLAFPASDRHEVVLGVLAGERCPHGYPDQGGGCEVCGNPQLDEAKR